MNVVFEQFLFLYPEKLLKIICFTISVKGRRDRDRMVVRFTSIYATSASHH